MTGKRTLFLVRHAAVEGEGRFFYGSSDVPLSEKGRRQALQLADKAQEWELDRLVGSDRLRVRQTVEPLLERLGSDCGFHPEPGLRERHFGLWEGLDWEEVVRQYPQLAQRFHDDWLRILPPEGEPLEEMEQRVTQTWEKIWQTPWKRLLLLAHGGPNRLLLRHFLGFPMRNLFRVSQEYAVMTRVDFYDGTPVLKSLNA